MNRRNFLKAFTGAAVGAGVLAYAPKPLKSLPFAAEEFYGMPLEKLMEIQYQMNRLESVVKQHFYGYAGRPFRVKPS